MKKRIRIEVDDNEICNVWLDGKNISKSINKLYFEYKAEGQKSILRLERDFSEA